MIEKRFEVYDDGFSKHIEDTYYTEDKHEHNLYDIWEMCNKLNELYQENEQLKFEIKGIEDLLRSYQKTVRHDAKLLADATSNGYLPPLEEWREIE